MTTTVTKSFTFDAAHRLAKGYYGKCKYPHGHTYRVEITVQLTDGELGDYDMAVDFGAFKPIKEWVENTFDHKMILHKDDPFLKHYKDALIAANIQPEFAIAVIGGNPTAEVFAQIIAGESIVLFPKGVFVEKVTVYETPTSYATYYCEK